MEIWPEVNYEHLNFVEIEIAAGMFADLESLICVQFDHLWIICHVCYKPFLLHSMRHEAVWTGTGMHHFAIFLLEQLAWPRLAAQGLSRLGLGLECCCTECCEGGQRVSHCLDLMASSPWFLRHFCGGIFQPCGLIYVVLWKDIGVSTGDTTIRPDVICYSKSTPPSLKLCQNIGTSVSRSRQLG